MYIYIYILFVYIYYIYILYVYKLYIVYKCCLVRCVNVVCIYIYMYIFINYFQHDLSKKDYDNHKLRFAKNTMIIIKFSPTFFLSYK